MDASQVLICKALGTQDYQSVLNCQKIVKPYRAVMGEYIQLLHNGINHWFLSFCLNSHIQVCDSLNSTLISTSRKSIQSLYKNVGQKNDSGNVRVTFLPVQKHNWAYVGMGIIVVFLQWHLLLKSLLGNHRSRQYLMWLKCMITSSFV